MCILNGFKDITILGQDGDLKWPETPKEFNRRFYNLGLPDGVFGISEYLVCYNGLPITSSALKTEKKI